MSAKRFEPFGGGQQNRWTFFRPASGLKCVWFVAQCANINIYQFFWPIFAFDQTTTLPLPCQGKLQTPATPSKPTRPLLDHWATEHWLPNNSPTSSKGGRPVPVHLRPPLARRQVGDRNGAACLVRCWCHYGSCRSRHYRQVTDFSDLTKYMTS